MKLGPNWSARGLKGSRSIQNPNPRTSIPKRLVRYISTWNWHLNRPIADFWLDSSLPVTETCILPLVMARLESVPFISVVRGMADLQQDILKHAK